MPTVAERIQRVQVGGTDMRALITLDSADNGHNLGVG